MLRRQETRYKPAWLLAKAKKTGAMGGYLPVLVVLAGCDSKVRNVARVFRSRVCVSKGKVVRGTETPVVNRSCGADRQPMWRVIDCHRLG